MRRLLLIGGGGHCHSVIDSVFSMNVYDEIGIIDDVYSSFQGVNVIGRDRDLPRLFQEGWSDAFISVGSIETTVTRRRLYETVKEIGFTVPSLIDASAVVAKGCIINEGTYIAKSTVVNAGVYLGICSIINTGVIVEHDCLVGDFSHISPGAILCGQVKVGSDTHVGAGSVVRQQIVIGNHTLTGIGSVIVKDLPDHIKAYGNPCKVVAI